MARTIRAFAEWIAKHSIDILQPAMVFILHTLTSEVAMVNKRGWLFRSDHDLGRCIALLQWNLQRHLVR